jgi:hypothetical protein
LADIERHIADANRRITTQDARVVAMEQNGHKDAKSARNLLDGLIESQRLFMFYRAYLADGVQRNRL